MPDFTLFAACESELALTIEIDPVDAAMRDLRGFVEQDNWAGVHLLMCWKRSLLQSCSRNEVVVFLEEIEKKLAGAYVADKTNGWKPPEPGSRLLWSYVVEPNDCLWAQLGQMKTPD